MIARTPLDACPECGYLVGHTPAADSEIPLPTIAGLFLPACIWELIIQ